MLCDKFYDAIEAILYIANSATGSPVGSKEICNHQGRTARSLEPLLQILVKNGILKGTKGPKGGYNLAKEKRKISCAEIYSIIQESYQKGYDDNKNYIAINSVKPLQNNINEAINSKLSKINIEDLYNKLPQADNTQQPIDDFYI